MTVAILLPALIAAVAAVVATAAHRRVVPPLAARVITMTMVAVVVAVIPAVVVLAFGLHEHVPQWLGVPAVALLGVSALRLVRVRRSWIRARCEGTSGVEVVPSRELFAYTMPGPGGHIVVSQRLVDHLDDVEYAIVLAHERAHAAHRHDRFVVLGAISVALVPMLAPLHKRLRFALERWADESTVTDLDVERTLVARTLATVALSTAA